MRQSVLERASRAGKSLLFPGSAVFTSAGYQDRAALLHPRQIGVVGGTCGEAGGATEFVSQDIAIGPFSGFGVTIAEGHAAAVIVVMSGRVDPGCCFCGVLDPITVID